MALTSLETALGSGKCVRRTSEQEEKIVKGKKIMYAIYNSTCSHIECVMYHKAVDS